MLHRARGCPKNVTSPSASYKPITPFGIPIFPCPARPPIPRISPSRISRSIPRSTSPGIFTHRSRMDMAVPAPSSEERLSTLITLSSPRPIIKAAIFSGEASALEKVEIRVPSRRMVILSAASITSSRRCVMKMIAIPWLAMLFITFKSCWASLSVRTAVGSSKTNSFMPCLSISRAISMNCI